MNTPEPRPAAKDPPWTSEQRRGRVLLLDDDGQLKSLMSTFLFEQGYLVQEASNGVEGIRALTEHEFDYVICDLMMPKLPGDMFYLAVQRIRPELCSRFVFITGHQGDEKILRFVESVNCPILTKPFPLQDLIEMIGFLEVRSLLAA